MQTSPFSSINGGEHFDQNINLRSSVVEVGEGQVPNLGQEQEAQLNTLLNDRYEIEAIK